MSKHEIIKKTNAFLTGTLDIDPALIMPDTELKRDIGITSVDAVAIAVPQISNIKSQISNADLRRMIMRKVNPQLPLFSQLYDVEITDTPLARTEKQTIKRYLYK